MNQFEANPDTLKSNAAHGSDYAEKLRTWIDQYDTSEFYEAYSRAVSFIGAPMTAALRQHGQLLREQTLALADRYQATAEASKASAGEVTSADQDSARTITNTTHNL